MSSSRRHRRRRTTRAERQMQILWRILIVAVIAAVAFFCAIHRAGSEKTQENMVSAEASSAAAEQNTLNAGNTVISSPAQTEENAAQPSPAAQTAEDTDGTGTGPAGSSAADSGTVPGQTATPAAPSAGSTMTGTAGTDLITPAAGTSSESVKYEDPLSDKTLADAKARQKLLNLNDADLVEALREREVPEELIEFMEEYPETREFVVDYLFQPDTPPSKDVSGEVKKGVIPHFLQWDKRWGYEKYGGSFLAVSACGPTAMSEVYCGLTGKSDMNPYEMSQWAEDMGYHVPGSGTSWELMTGGARRLGLSAWSVDVSGHAILAELEEGNPVICSMAPGDFTYFGHFIVLVSVDNAGNINIRDSNSNIRTQRSWTMDELLWQIKSCWAYSYDEEEED